jgi:hypothetical protein
MLKLSSLQVELNPVRHMVVDASCLDKSLDLRLVLYTMGVLTTLTVSCFIVTVAVISHILHHVHPHICFY